MTAASDIRKNTRRCPRAWAAALVLAAAATVSAAGPAPAAEILDGIKGADDRLTLPSDEYPWSAVGRVNPQTGGHCSGALVGRSLAVTAAHCLYDTRKQWFVPPAEVHFVAGYRDGQFIAHSTARAYWIPPGYREGQAPTGETAVHDWAIIELNEPIGDIAGWFGVAPLDKAGFERAISDATRFVQAGYSRDSKLHLTAHIGCDMEGYARGLDLIVHACDAVPGDSGSPIFFFERGYPMLAGVHVATTRNKVPVRGIAVPTGTFFAGVREMGGGRPGLPSEAGLMPGETASLLLGILGFRPDGNLSRAIGAFQDQRGVTPNGQLAYELVGQLVDAMGEQR
ncbi:MAG: trypsin-like serine protease [Rhodospirillales bacterium]